MNLASRVASPVSERAGLATARRVASLAWSGLEYRYETACGFVLFRDWLECTACGAQYSLVCRKWIAPARPDKP